MGMTAHAWIDGRIESADAPLLRVTDRGFQLGDGIFETMRARRGVPIELDEHLERLRESAVPLGIQLPEEDGPLIGAIAAILRAEGLAGDGSGNHAPGDAALRITVSRGAIPGRGLSPTAAAAGKPASGEPGSRRTDEVTTDRPRSTTVAEGGAYGHAWTTIVGLAARRREDDLARGVGVRPPRGGARRR